MISIGSHTRVFLAAGVTDMRKSIDGLSVLVIDVLEADPLSSHLFVFCNRLRDKIKIFYWHNNASGSSTVAWIVSDSGGQAQRNPPRLRSFLLPESDVFGKISAMSSTALPLPNDPVQLKADVIQLRDVVQEKERTLNEKVQRIKQLLDYILLMRKRQFGPSSEQFNIDQINLFDEAELEQLLGDLDLPVDPDEVAAPAQEQAEADKKKPKRRPLPEHLNRIEKIIDFSDEEKTAMEGKWTFIGYDTSEQLAVIPRQHYVILFKRAKYVAKNADVAGAEQGVIIAPRADQIIPKSIAHSSVIADIGYDRMAAAFL